MLDPQYCNITQVRKNGEWIDTHFECLEINDTVRFLKPDRTEYPPEQMLGKIQIVREFPCLLVDPAGEEVTMPPRRVWGNEAAEQVTESVVCHRPAHHYEVAGKQNLAFIHVAGGHLVSGTTNEDLLTVLIHRTEILDSQTPCDENKVGLEKMREALVAFQQRADRMKASKAAA